MLTRSGILGGSGLTPPPDLTYTVNWNPTSNLTNWRAKKAATRAGTGRTLVAVAGDSTTIGLGAGTGGLAFPGAHDLSFPMRMAAYMAAGGLPTTIDSQVGGAPGFSTLADMASYNPRLSTTGSTWVGASSPSAFSIGGEGFQNTSSTVDLLTFTPIQQVDTIKLFLYSSAVLGSVKWNLDGGSDTTVAENPTVALLTRTLTMAKGIHAVNEKRVNGTVLSLGWMAYDSTTAAVDVINIGSSGSTSTNWNNSAAAYNPIGALAVLAADLLIINLGINEWEAAVSQGTFSTNIQALITAQKATGGDVIICMPTPTGAIATPSQQAAYLTTLTTLANSNNVPLVDWTGKFVSYAVQNGLGRMFDTKHPKAPIYDDMGKYLSQLLLAA